MTAEDTTSRRPPVGLLVHPVVLVAIAITAVNDHLLKGSGLIPGVVTGKLSDVTGLFFFPILLAVLFFLLARLLALLVPNRLTFQLAQQRRIFIDVAATLTVVVFAAANLLEFANLIVERFWGVITKDPTDLLCLPMVLVARQWTLKRWPARFPADTVDRPGLTLNWRHALALAFAVVVSAATSPARTTSVTGYPYWEVTELTVHCIHDVEARAWFAKSGSDGAGLVVRFDTTDEHRRTVEVLGATFEVWRERGTRTAAGKFVDGEPTESHLKVAPRKSVYIPFEFDNRRAWEERLHNGRITLQLRVDDQPYELEFNARHHSAEMNEHYLRYEVWQHGDYTGESTGWGQDPENPDLERTGPHTKREDEHLRRDRVTQSPVRIHTDISWEGGCPGGNDE